MTGKAAGRGKDFRAAIRHSKCYLRRNLGAFHLRPWELYWAKLRDRCASFRRQHPIGRGFSAPYRVIEKLGQAKAQIEREFMLYHQKRQRQLQAQYGVSVDQDFANLAADSALLLIKKEGLQREIEALDLEKRQRLGQDAAVSDLRPQESSGPAGNVRTLVVDRGRQGPALRM
ncbi:hypothetical protein A1359_20925 [Methylomonas lenta]|uniref:Uncharacterized protein n=1 Tax=Methylomonas lenta TaxID=980561 RepID=A0A177NRA0_9GAMM|nr:hypothetical protein [Methylomonas lenta]OAI20402.1 hypothetical protein A1359_20925 [Methylomonas lenta]